MFLGENDLLLSALTWYIYIYIYIYIYTFFFSFAKKLSLLCLFGESEWGKLNKTSQTSYGMHKGGQSYIGRGTTLSHSQSKGGRQTNSSILVKENLNVGIICLIKFCENSLLPAKCCFLPCKHAYKEKTKPLQCYLYLFWLQSEIMEGYH